LTDSNDFQNDRFGAGHPNLTGQGVYAQSVDNYIIVLNPPVTSASATADGQPYAFKTWTQHDVEVTLSAKNFISEAGVGKTYYAVDNPNCSTAEAQLRNCLIYGGPFTLTKSGKHIVTFFSENGHGYLEPSAQTVEVWIDKEPPVMTCSATPTTLWPPNQSFIPVATSVTAIDAISGPEPFLLASVTTSEGSVSSETRGFVIGTPDTDGEMEASRLGTESGRVYGLTYQSEDEVGNVGSCTVEVTVPHDQRDNENGNGNGNGQGNTNGKSGNGNGAATDHPGSPGNGNGIVQSDGGNPGNGNANGVANGQGRSLGDGSGNGNSEAVGIGGTPSNGDGNGVAAGNNASPDGARANGVAEGAAENRARTL
jgi:hypothetical protein